MATKLDAVRYAAVVNMTYQLGLDGLSKFLHFLAALQAQNWDGAAFEGMNSVWAKQTPGRAKRMMDQIKTGEWQWK
jgi:lysozyme